MRTIICFKPINLAHREIGGVDIFKAKSIQLISAKVTNRSRTSTKQIGFSQPFHLISSPRSKSLKQKHKGKTRQTQEKGASRKRLSSHRQGDLLCFCNFQSNLANPEIPINHLRCNARAVRAKNGKLHFQYGFLTIRRHSPRHRRNCRQRCLEYLRIWPGHPGNA